jgi:hypothetical protein
LGGRSRAAHLRSASSTTDSTPKLVNFSPHGSEGVSELTLAGDTPGLKGTSGLTEGGLDPIWAERQIAHARARRMRDSVGNRSRRRA